MMNIDIDISSFACLLDLVSIDLLIVLLPKEKNKKERRESKVLYIYVYL